MHAYKISVMSKVPTPSGSHTTNKPLLSTAAGLSVSLSH